MKHISCPLCHGRGVIMAESMHHYVDCEECDGTGEVKVDDETDEDDGPVWDYDEYDWPESVRNM